MQELLNSFNCFPLAELEVGQHFYWQIGGLKLHGQILMTSWVVMAILIVAAFLATRDRKSVV